MNDAPTVIAEKQNYRLVHQVRDQTRYPNASDLTLEEYTIDAMGNGRWVYVSSWYLDPFPVGSISASGSQPVDHLMKAELALKLLVDPTHNVRANR